MASRNNVATIEGHTSTVACLAFSPTGDTLASGGWDRTIQLWNVKSRKITATLRQHAHTVSSLAFSPDGKTLASGSYDYKVKLWDIPPAVANEDGRDSQ